MIKIIVYKSDNQSKIWMKDTYHNLLYVLQFRVSRINEQMFCKIICLLVYVIAICKSGKKLMKVIQRKIRYYCKWYKTTK